MNITGDMVECEVVKIKRVDDEKGGFHGVMQEIKIPGYKAPVQYWLDDNKAVSYTHLLLFLLKIRRIFYSNEGKWIV